MKWKYGREVEQSNKISFNPYGLNLRGQRYQYVKMIAPNHVGSEEQMEGVKAFQEKRLPDYSRFR